MINLESKIRISDSQVLKRHNQAKIIKKSVFLFWLLDMSMIIYVIMSID